MEFNVKLLSRKLAPPFRYYIHYAIGKFLMDDNGEVNELIMNKAGGPLLTERFENTGRYHMRLVEHDTEDVFTVDIEGKLNLNNEYMYTQMITINTSPWQLTS